MEDLLELTKEIILLSKKFKQSLENNEGSPFSIECFNMIYNKAVITYETYNNYYKVWISNEYVSEFNNIEDLNELHAIRCMEVGKMLFVGVTSTVEFKIREFIYNTNDHKLKKCIDRTKDVYDEFSSIFNELPENIKLKLNKLKKKLKNLPPSDSISKIIDKSKSERIISDLEYDKWKFILELRNITVHNNNIASKDMELLINGRKFEMIKGMMVRDKVDFFLVLTKEILLLINNWFVNQK